MAKLRRSPLKMLSGRNKSGGAIARLLKANQKRVAAQVGAKTRKAKK